MKIRCIKSLVLVPEGRATLTIDPPLQGNERPIALNVGLLRSEGGVHLESLTPSRVVVVNTMSVPAVTVFAIIETKAPPALLAFASQLLHRLTLPERS